MKIRGLSYQNGIFYIGKNHVACAYHDKGVLNTWLKPICASTLIQMMKQVIWSMPLWYKLFTVIYLGLIFLPKIIELWQPLPWSGLPFYTVFYLMFGTHFIFPNELKKYHGAEHKVFSARGVIRRARLYQINKASITNRHCSTNTVVIYFMCVLIGTSLIVLATKQLSSALAIASYGSLFAIPIIQRLMDVKGFVFLRKSILRLSYWLQMYVTTKEPDRMHMIASIESYRKLAKEEFPERLIVRKIPSKKEEKHLAIVDVTVIPIGTETASVSMYVAEMQEVLKTFDGKISYQLTPMSTLIEGELPILFEVIQAIHEVPFKNGVSRVATNIRIDDRRDKHATMAGKLEAVKAHLNSTNENELNN